MFGFFHIRFLTTQLVKMDALEILYHYYPADNALRRLLLHHSQQVQQKAIACLTCHPELSLDAALVRNGALLHDIGIFRTDAPGIHCYGTHHYLLHGILGGALMREQGHEEMARICERHTGTGLRACVFEKRGLPVPERLQNDPDAFMPESLEEQLVCYADKFFSKSHPNTEKNYEQVLHSLQKFGDEGAKRFAEWHALFGEKG